MKSEDEIRRATKWYQEKAATIRKIADPLPSGYQKDSLYDCALEFEGKAELLEWVLNETA